MENIATERFIETIPRQKFHTSDVEYETNNIKVLGICGREGAGKTTIANALTESTGPAYEMREVDPITYICDVIFGENDQIWHLKRSEQIIVMKHMLHTYVDTKWVENHSDMCLAPFDLPVSSNTNWVEFSLATPLKKICSVIFGVPYDMLLAQTPEDRKARETVKCGEGFDKLPYVMNGRICLEYFGTDVMRNRFDRDIWMKMLKRDVSTAIKAGQRVVIPDIRFANELELVNELDGTLMTVYREDSDLILTDVDRETHPAKWNFLEFYMLAKKRLMYKNICVLNMLKTDINQILS